ncbi:hypothetical protein, partial [Klebsiella pneumoniae]|uniref:hypothetical protein n=3 Tax=Klebsiella pneumoniae TaxID=573 RepID=UPI003008D9C3
CALQPAASCRHSTLLQNSGSVNDYSGPPGQLPGITTTFRKICSEQLSPGNNALYVWDSFQYLMRLYLHQKINNVTA